MNKLAGEQADAHAGDKLAYLADEQAGVHAGDFGEQVGVQAGE